MALACRLKNNVRGLQAQNRFFTFFKRGNLHFKGKKPGAKIKKNKTESWAHITQS
jgi:hypothetical protein